MRASPRSNRRPRRPHSLRTGASLRAPSGRAKTFLQTGGSGTAANVRRLRPTTAPVRYPLRRAEPAVPGRVLDDRSLKPWPVSLRDFGKELSNPSWRAQLSHSRRLFANLGAVRGAVCERARLGRRPGLAAALHRAQPRLGRQGRRAGSTSG